MKPSERQIGGNHYAQFAIQPGEFIYRNGIGWHEANAIKYLCRWKIKGGLQDLLKAKHYIELLIELQDETELRQAGVDPAESSADSNLHD